jgi:hypothetical protein
MTDGLLSFLTAMNQHLSVPADYCNHQHSFCRFKVDDNCLVYVLWVFCLEVLRFSHPVDTNTRHKEGNHELVYSVNIER